ncbi:uncharacterized protein [Prorops nasuta]|uniref:uncharacterized protein isoform X2 n=1 Tax=Prorops nasuta TaxID=863751 RepID=UPI0034CD62C7
MSRCSKMEEASSSYAMDQRRITSKKARDEIVEPVLLPAASPPPPGFVYSPVPRPEPITDEHRNVNQPAYNSSSKANPNTAKQTNCFDTIINDIKPISFNINARITEKHLSSSLQGSIQPWKIAATIILIVGVILISLAIYLCTRPLIFDHLWSAEEDKFATLNSQEQEVIKPETVSDYRDDTWYIDLD